MVAFLHFLLLISASLFVKAKSVVVFPKAKPGCKDTCGNNVTIPFPFGIGAGCFLDEWYEVVCLGKTAKLKKVGAEVLKISLPNFPVNDNPGRITVNMPITFDNATPNCTAAASEIQHGESTDFTGSNFYYSEENLFLAVGCHTSFFLSNITDASVGCQTKCRATGTESRWYGDCLGHNCCQDKIRSVFFQVLNINFLKENGRDAADTCSYAFMADQSWLRPNVTELESVRRMGHAPVLLDWGVNNMSDIGIDFWTTGRKSDFSCDDSNGVFTQCYCRRGFHGNAYLVDGCQDVNECEDPSKYFCDNKCVNHRGGYSCVDSKRTIKVVSTSIGAAVGAFLLLLLGRLLYKFFKRRKQLKLKQKLFKRNGGLLLQQQLSSPGANNVERGKLFSSKELEKATDKFNEDRILGKGGQGTVYKGMLTDGRIVAVKKSKVLDEGSVEQFINEVFILSQINHRNVVKLLGWCLETEVPLLVYEFIPNGNLYQYLHNSNEESVSWDTRLRLATEVAGALAYLHSAASIPIYHRDIKTANILLDEKYRAKIADFGASKSVALDQTHVTTLVQGTFGYLDPEYFQSSHFTDRSDVYSFGVVLAELLTGQKPASVLRESEGKSLVTYFIISMEQNRLLNILDAQVLNQGNEEEIIIVADIARRCIRMNGRSRPTMKEVALELEAVVKRSQQQRHSDILIEPNPRIIETGVIEIEARDAALRSKGLKVDDDTVAMSMNLSPILLSSDSW